MKILWNERIAEENVEVNKALNFECSTSNGYPNCNAGRQKASTLDLSSLDTVE